MKTPIAVTIAGSDSGGGAGIQADLKTFSALGVYGASVVAALTAQNTRGVTAIHDVPADFVTAQIDAVFSDLDVGAVKIGMLSRPETIQAVAAGLARYRQTKVVLDPVMIATSGDRLLAPEAIETLRRVLIPRALVITPNLPEAAALLDAPPAASESEMREQGEKLLAFGARAVLIKGGHAEGAEAIDLLVEESSVARLVGRTDRYEEHPRHRLHAVFRDSRRPCQGPRSRGGGAAGKDLCHRRDQGIRPACDRSRSRPGASFSCLVVKEQGERTHDQDYAAKADDGGRNGNCRGACRARHRARGDAALAHGDLVAKAPAGTGHVGRAHRRAHPRAVGRKT